MNLASVARFVAFTHFAIALAMVVPMLLALRSGLGAAIGYAAGAGAGVAVGGLCLAALNNVRPQALVRAGLRELMLAFVLFWAAAPLVGSIPFLIEGFSWTEAWFEAVSAVTTTGAWLSDPVARSTPHDMLYRASLQWIGGLVSLATAAAVFVRPEFIGIDSTVPPFSRGESGSYLRAFDQGVRAFFPVYALITSLGFAAFVIVGVPGAEAATMALSLTSSGGFVPHAAGMVAYPPLASLIAATLMVFSAMNFIVLASLALGHAARVRGKGDPETRIFLALIPVIALIFWLSQGAGDVDRLVAHAFNAISVLSTNGVLVGEVDPALVPVLVTAIIGGAAVSTAGGIKILRWLLTFRRAGEEIWKLTHPGGVARHAPSANEFGVWIHTLAFAVITAALVLTTTFFGFSLEISAAAAIAVISNTGPLLELAPQMTADYGVFDPALRVLFGMGMIAGRLEVVVLMVVFNNRFWQG